MERFFIMRRIALLALLHYIHLTQSDLERIFEMLLDLREKETDYDDDNALLELIVRITKTRRSPLHPAAIPIAQIPALAAGLLY